MSRSKLKRPRGRSAQVREAVIGAARDLFQADEALPTLTQIAEKAGVQRTTIYRRWGGLDAVMLDAVGTMIAGEIVMPDEGSLRGDLKVLMEQSQAFLSSELGGKLLKMLLGSSDEVKRWYWDNRYLAVRLVFERAAGRGEIAAGGDWNTFLDVIVAPLYYGRIVKGGEWSPVAAQLAIDMTCSFLKAIPGNSHSKT